MPAWAPLMKATAMTQNSVTGMRNFQPNFMNWSYRVRGSVPRSHTKNHMKTHSLTVNQSRPHQPRRQPAVHDVVQPEGRLVAAEEHRRGQGGDREHVDVLAEEEHAEPHPGVLGVESGDQFALALGEVERQPVGLADHGDDVDDEADDQREHVPHSVLRGDDLARCDIDPAYRNTATSDRPIAIS